jgi:predicted nucleotidyltransferase
MLQDKYKSIILDICNRHLADPYELYLFGSRARGDESYCSDIDLAINTKEKEKKSYKLALIKQDLEEARIPFFVDFVDIDFADKELKDSIIKDGITLNE